MVPPYGAAKPAVEENEHEQQPIEIKIGKMIFYVTVALGYGSSTGLTVFNVLAETPSREALLVTRFFRPTLRDTHSAACTSMASRSNRQYAGSRADQELYLGIGGQDVLRI